jgi:hypothetical protein
MVSAQLPASGKYQLCGLTLVWIGYTQFRMVQQLKIQPPRTSLLPRTNTTPPVVALEVLVQIFGAFSQNSTVPLDKPPNNCSNAIKVIIHADHGVSKLKYRLNSW